MHFYLTSIWVLCVKFEFNYWRKKKKTTNHSRMWVAANFVQFQVHCYYSSSPFITPKDFHSPVKFCFHKRTIPSSPELARIVPVIFHSTRQTFFFFFWRTESKTKKKGDQHISSICAHFRNHTSSGNWLTRWHGENLWGDRHFNIIFLVTNCRIWSIQTWSNKTNLFFCLFPEHKIFFDGFGTFD